MKIKDLKSIKDAKGGFILYQSDRLCSANIKDENGKPIDGIVELKINDVKWVNLNFESVDCEPKTVRFLRVYTDRGYLALDVRDFLDMDITFKGFDILFGYIRAFASAIGGSKKC